MIIIETTTRERLVLVPEKQIVCTTHTRDATPDDLARAGYVLEAAGAEHIRAILVAAERPLLARAEKAEAHIQSLHDAEQETRRILDAVLGERTSDAATRLHNDWVDTRERAEKAEREREECESVLTAMGARAREAEEFARVLEVERDTARAELARLTAPAEGEPTDEEILDAWQHAGAGVTEAWLFRAGVAHERARQQPAQDRATDEELERVYSNAYARAWESELSTPDRGERAGVLAVAARVRQERCLVARAVAANVDVRVCEDNDGGFMVGVHATGCDEELARCVPASDVPATLARLLGEVAK